MDKLLFLHFLIFLTKSLINRVTKFDRFPEYKWARLLSENCEFQKIFFFSKYELDWRKIMLFEVTKVLFPTSRYEHFSVRPKFGT